MKIRQIVTLFVVGILLAGSAAAADSARARLNAFAEGIHSLSSTFVQQVEDARGDARPEIHGTLALAEPRLFRWHTEPPQKQLIVADGARVWVYDPLLEQVTVRRQTTGTAHSPLTVLTDLSRLDQDFKVTEAGSHDGLDWLRLTPRAEQAQFDYVAIGMDGEVPRTMVFANKLGGESRITFHDWQRNPDLPAGTFQFTPPEGVAVVGRGVNVPEVQGLGNG